MEISCENAILMDRNALEIDSLGHVKSAIEKIKAANQTYSARVGLGANIEELEIRQTDGTMERLLIRDTLCNLQNELYIKEQSLLRRERDDIEKVKIIQNLTEEHICSEELPTLEINTLSNNIVKWVGKIYNKFKQVERGSPQLMMNFVFTVKK